MKPKNAVKRPRKSAPYPALRKSIIMDKVKAQDLRDLNMVFSCEECSYYNLNTDACAMGFNHQKHKRDAQLKLYELTGRMAICRAQEID